MHFEHICGEYFFFLILTLSLKRDHNVFVYQLMGSALNFFLYDQWLLPSFRYLANNMLSGPIPGWITNKVDSRFDTFTFRSFCTLIATCCIVPNHYQCTLNCLNIYSKLLRSIDIYSSAGFLISTVDNVLTHIQVSIFFETFVIK